MPKDDVSGRSVRMQPLWTRVDANRTKLTVFVVLFVLGSSALLSGALVAVPGALVGLSIAGPGYWRGYAIAVAVAFGTMLLVGSLLSAIQIANAADWVRNSFRGRVLGDGEHPELRQVVADMALAGGLAGPPEIVILPDAGENAFALGTARERATIGVTEGMLERFSADELRAVMATLVARIAAGDIMFGTALAALMGPIKVIRESPEHIGDSGCADGCSGCSVPDTDNSAGCLVILWVAVIAAVTYAAVLLAAWIVTVWGRLLQRTSYEKADAEGMLLLKDPAPMISALRKAIHSSTKVSEGDQSYDGIFYSPTSGTSRVDKAERRRFERLAEVLGVDGLAASLDAKS